MGTVRCGVRGARGLLACAALLWLPSLAGAQVISGVLMQPDSVTPASGVIVVASRPANDSLLARTMTSGNGRYYLTLAAGPVRLRALRIGHKPFVIGTLTLGARETREVRAVLPNTPIVLSTVTTSVTSACRQTGAAGEAVATVFEEARKALISTKLTSRDAAPIVLIGHFSEQRSLANRSRMARKHEFSEGASMKPFRSLPPDSLARVGYVENDDSGATYWAPDTDVLLSETFAAGHCLDLTNGTGDRAGWIGLTFRPAARATGVIDVRGTLWLDRQTLELRRMEYLYEGQTAELRSVNPGGTVEFTRLADGFWFINAFEIRMPRFSSQLVGPRMAGLTVAGGEVWRVRRGDDVVYSNGATYPVKDDDAEPADSALASPTCAPGAKGVVAGRIAGKVDDDRGAALGGAVVHVEWQENYKATGGQLTWQTRQLSTLAASDGSFAVCGVPRGQLITVLGQFGTYKAQKVALRLSPGEPQARVDLRIHGVRRAAPAKP